MPAIEYSPSKVDLYYPARRGNFFVDMDPSNEQAVCAEMARLAYCRKEPSFSFDQETINRVLNGMGFDCQFFESKGTKNGRGSHCFLATNTEKKLAIVAFRGTDADDPTDLLDDADVLPIRWAAGGLVHSGFARSLGDVQVDLLAALAMLEGLDYRTIHTGHSLGAATATLLSSLRKPKMLYTIGSPRVGDGDFIASLKGIESRRYVGCCDLVTRVPPEGLPNVRYEHFGAPYFINKAREVMIDPSADFMKDDRLSASEEYILEHGWRSGNVAVRELADHTPINYVSAIQAAG